MARLGRQLSYYGTSTLHGHWELELEGCELQEQSNNRSPSEVLLDFCANHSSHITKVHLSIWTQEKKQLIHTVLLILTEDIILLVEVILQGSPQSYSFHYERHVRVWAHHMVKLLGGTVCMRFPLSFSRLSWSTHLCSFTQKLGTVPLVTEEGLSVDLTRMHNGHLVGEMFRACPTGSRPWGRLRTGWRDYIFLLGGKWIYVVLKEP